MKTWEELSVLSSQPCHREHGEVLHCADSESHVWALGRVTAGGMFLCPWFILPLVTMQTPLVWAVVWVQVNVQGLWRTVPPLTCCDIPFYPSLAAALRRADIVLCWLRYWLSWTWHCWRAHPSDVDTWANRLTNSYNTQAQIQGFELAHPQIYLINELLEHVKSLVLLIQVCRISLTQGNNRISDRSPSEDLVLMV